MAISWWNIILSMDNMNTHCFGHIELALPLHLDLAIFKKPLGNKGLMRFFSSNFQFETHGHLAAAERAEKNSKS